MRFVTFNAIQSDGKVPIEVVADNVCWIMPVGIVEKSDIAGADNKPIQTRRFVAGLCFGVPQPIPVDCSVEEAKKALSLDKD